MWSGLSPYDQTLHSFYCEPCQLSWLCSKWAAKATRISWLNQGDAPHNTQYIKKKFKNSILYLQRSVTSSNSGHQAKGLNLSYWTRTKLRDPHTIKYVCQTRLRKHWEWVPPINVEVSVKLDCANIESHQSMWRCMGISHLKLGKKKLT